MVIERCEQLAQLLSTPTLASVVGLCPELENQLPRDDEAEEKEVK